MSSVIALIPARGGSKGIPRKNLQILAGKPLIAHTLLDALKCPAIDRVIVSTDDEEIAAVARSHGAEVPYLRPPELAQDETPDLPVFQHALEWLAKQKAEPDLLVHLRPTHPIRDIPVIQEAIERIKKNPEADSLRSVSWPTQTPYKMWRIEEGFLRPLLRMEGLAEPYSRPRQKLPEVFWQNGYVDIIRPRTILVLQSMAGEKILPFITRIPYVEIDDANSLSLAEQLLRLRREGKLLDSQPTMGVPS